MKESEVAGLFAIAAIAIAGFAVGMTIGSHQTVSVKSEAVKYGHAIWVADAKGDTTFTWIVR